MLSLSNRSRVTSHVLWLALTGLALAASAAGCAADEARPEEARADEAPLMVTGTADRQLALSYGPGPKAVLTAYKVAYNTTPAAFGSAPRANAVVDGTRATGEYPSLSFDGGYTHAPFGFDAGREITVAAIAIAPYGVDQTNPETAASTPNAGVNVWNPTLNNGAGGWGGCADFSTDGAYNIPLLEDRITYVKKVTCKGRYFMWDSTWQGTPAKMGGLRELSIFTADPEPLCLTGSSPHSARGTIGDGNGAALIDNKCSTAWSGTSLAANDNRGQFELDARLPRIIPNITIKTFPQSQTTCGRYRFKVESGVWKAGVGVAWTQRDDRVVRLCQGSPNDTVTLPVSSTETAQWVRVTVRSSKYNFDGTLDAAFSAAGTEFTPIRILDVVLGSAPDPVPCLTEANRLGSVTAVLGLPGPLMSDKRCDVPSNSGVQALWPIFRNWSVDTATKASVSEIRLVPSVSWYRYPASLGLGYAAKATYKIHVADTWGAWSSLPLNATATDAGGSALPVNSDGTIGIYDQRTVRLKLAAPISSRFIQVRANSPDAHIDFYEVGFY